MMGVVIVVKCAIGSLTKDIKVRLYVKVITWSGGICLIYMHDARGQAAPERECVYIRQIPTDHVIIIMLH